MEKKQNLNEMVFRNHYNTLSKKEKEKIRNSILSESGMSYPTFYNKLRYNTFKPLELKLINTIINSRK